MRPARSGDRADLCKVCLLAGAAGADASAREDDPELLGLVFAVPYVALAPDLAHVIEDASGVCGTLLGTHDSAAFYDRYEDSWLVPLRQRIADPGPERERWRGSDWVRRLIHHPPAIFPAAPAVVSAALFPPAMAVSGS